MKKTENETSKCHPQSVTLKVSHIRQMFRHEEKGKCRQVHGKQTNSIRQEIQSEMIQHMPFVCLGMVIKLSCKAREKVGITRLVSL